MSFKDKLNLFLKDRGYATYNELEMFAKSEGHKTETLTRYLRPSNSPHLARMYRNGAIFGYGLKDSPVVKDTCPQCKVWLNHSSNCPTKAQKTVSALF